jgi:hypothetical protein
MSKNADTRKSLMLNDEEYTRISAIATRAGVPRPMVLAAALDVADESRLFAKLADRKAAEKAAQAKDTEKRAALLQLAGQLDIGQIEALLEQVKRS